MTEEIEQGRRNIVMFLTSLRRSIDFPLRNKSRMTNEERERFMRTTLMVEAARIRFDTYVRYNQPPTSSDWTEACEELIQFINKFSRSADIDQKILGRRLMVSLVPHRDRDSQFPYLFGSRDKPVRIDDALRIFQEYLFEFRDKLAGSQGKLAFGDLERIVPHQQVAPVQFAIVEGRIVVSKRMPQAAKADRANIHSALEYIRGSGEQLIGNLENSNCDRRLLESVKELQAQLIADGNIVKIGLMNMACGVIGAQFHVELPDAVAGMLNAYNGSISLYVAQFPEWEQFTNKAAAIDLDETDVASVDAAAGDVIDALGKNPALADPEVPKTIAFVRQFLSVPGASSKRAIFAMIRTIENLVSSIVRHSMDFLSQTAEKAVNAGSTAAAKIIIGLLGIALVSAAGVGPTAVRAGAPWVKQAAEIVQRQIEKAME